MSSKSISRTAKSDKVLPRWIQIAWKRDRCLLKIMTEMSRRIFQSVFTNALLVLSVNTVAQVISPLSAEIGRELLSHMSPLDRMNSAQLCELHLNRQTLRGDRALGEDLLKNPSASYLVLKTRSRIRSWREWDFLNYRRKEHILSSMESFWKELAPGHTVLYGFDLLTIAKQDFWIKRLKPSTLVTLDAFEAKYVERLRRRLMPLLNLNLKHSGYYPGFDDEVAPIGTIGDWYMHRLNSLILPDGVTVAHKITIRRNGFMRRGSDETFLPDLPHHYDTLEEALAAGGSSSDVCWEYSVIVNYNFEIINHDPHGFPQWCGF